MKKENVSLIMNKVIFAFVFTLFIVTAVFHRIINSGFALLIAFIVLAYLLVFMLLAGIGKAWNYIKQFLHGKARDENRPVQFLIWSAIWIPCFGVFLNYYPGTLSCDTPGQLAEALFVYPFENLNPLINTLCLTVFVQLGMHVGDVNTGVALYTLFQLSLYSVITGKVVYIMFKNGFSKLILFLVLCFYAINPINLVYATGMWKDTFFSVLLLATFVTIYNYLSMEKTEKRKMSWLLMLVTLTALSRNSAWTAMLLFGIIALLLKKKRIKRLGKIIIIGVVISVIIQGVLYPAFGIKSTHSSMAVSLQMQQVGRVAKEANLTSEEQKKIEYYLKEGKTVENLADSYEPMLVDPLRDVFDTDKLKDTVGLYSLCLELMREHPIASLDGIVDHTKPYWWPLSTSWIWDVRIFDNSYGVTRTPIILNGHDVASKLWDIFTKIPFYIVLNRGAIATWLALIGLFLSFENGNKVGAVLYVVPIAIIIGLILFSYAPLFRYMYAVFLMKPLLLAYQFIDNRE